MNPSDSSTVVDRPADPRPRGSVPAGAAPADGTSTNPPSADVPAAGAAGGQQPQSEPPEQIKAPGDAHGLTSSNAGDRTLVFRQMHVAVLLILGGCMLTVLGLVLVKETDATKLTAIVSLGTAVIGSGAALLPTGAAAGASARILSRDINAPSGGGFAAN